ncbi:TlyA family rRNA (cytidine-2'-O)-methyltransferase [Deefgea chitinilytica]|uniref:TlyA family rRNA (Cytidine-2'-O)-methyltransferase n=2 Tax=Chitinibacteraceae TaxID=2897177 RepID=A0ABS2CC36_9NEIS|nr:TlyA family rRNA (cytidine-2'-O)-methyltransferase [Deefgea chitinilytica]MBM9888943.1 TlyA family RNA methyltransferase [Deefgea sp. CFH1-16]
MMRADLWLVEHGFAHSRTAAQTMILAGRVSVDGKLLSKVATKLAPYAKVNVAADELDRYVSRGGLKLAGALAAAKLDVTGMLALDVGISTGGFTDCLLQAGARRVIGVEVGHDQLHSRLLADERVEQFEGVNARHLSLDVIAPALRDESIDLVVGDVSFISLTLVLPALRSVLPVGGQLLFLVKPQFELGPQALGKGGIVRDEALYPQVAEKIRLAASNTGFKVQNYFASPIAGGDGNKEFFIQAVVV